MQVMSVAEALAQLSESRGTYKVLQRSRDGDVGMYKPVRVDLQAPHDRDEAYVIAAGRGEVQLDGRKHPVETGDVVYVPKGMEHRFVNFTDDFATWVFFFGKG